MNTAISWTMSRLPAAGRSAWWTLRLASRLAIEFFAICGLLLCLGALLSQPGYPVYALDVIWSHLWPNVIPLFVVLEATSFILSERRL